MRTIEMPESASPLSDLVHEAESGSEIVFTRGGHAVARLVPHRDDVKRIIVSAEARAKALRALEEIDKLREELRLGPFDFAEFKADREAGRR